MKKTLFLVFVFSCFCHCLNAVNSTLIDKGVHWSDGEHQIFLHRAKGDQFSLTVISKKALSIAYHTRINSSIPVVKNLKTVDVNSIVRRYSFKHSFSKTTIWMSLKFRQGGNDLNKLNRAFYSSIFETIDINKLVSPIDSALNDTFDFKIPPLKK